MPRKSRLGFTLIELMVVVAIVVALLAILLPSMNRAIDLSIRVKCAAQMRQVGVAMINYAVSNHTALPPNSGDPPDDYPPGTYYVQSTGYDLREFVRPYLQDFAAFGCPNLDLPPMDDQANIRTVLYHSISYFGGKAWPQFGTGRGAPTRLSHADANGRRTLLSDELRDRSRSSFQPSRWRFNHGRGVRYTYASASDNPWGTSGNPSWGALFATELTDVDGMNATFYDLHVEWANAANTENAGYPTSWNNSVDIYGILP